MRILFVTLNGFRPYLRSFTDSVLARALVQKGHTVVAYTPAQQSDPLEEREDGILIRRILQLNDFDTFCYSREYLNLWKNLYHLVQLDSPDVIHLFHLRSSCNYPVTKIAQFLDIPILLSEWGLLHDDFLVNDRDRPLAAPIRYDNIIYRWRDCFENFRWLPRHGLHLAMKNYYRHYPLFAADRLLFLSQHNYYYLRRLGIPDERIVILPTPIDLHKPDIAAVDSEIYRLKTRPWIVFIGQFKLRKGFDLIVDAMGILTKKYPRATLFVISQNWHNTNFFYFVSKVIENKLQNNVCFLGAISEDDKWFLLSEADALVVPSRYEGFGLPLLEAMIAGCPIVATDVVAINEVIRDGFNGLLFPLEDAISLAERLSVLIDDKNLARSLVENGREYVKQHDINYLVCKFEEIYMSVLM